MDEVLAGQATCKTNTGLLFKNYHAFRHGDSRALTTREASWAALRSPAAMPLASVLTHLQKLGGHLWMGSPAVGKTQPQGPQGTEPHKMKAR